MPTWTKEMTWAVYLKALEAWIEQKNDMPEANKYQLVTESLKQNREVNGLMEYMAKHVLEVLNTVETQNVQQVIGILKRKYGKARMEDVEDLIMEWMSFKANEYEDEDDFLLAM